MKDFTVSNFVELEEKIYNTDIVDEIFMLDRINLNGDVTDYYYIVIAFKKDVSTNINGLYSNKLDIPFQSKELRQVFFESIRKKLNVR